MRRALAVGALSALCVLPVLADDPEPTSDPDLVKLRGRVVCLDALPATSDPESDPCKHEGARFELRVSPAEAVRFLPDDPLALILLDPQVREREIEVRGWRRPGGAFEILAVYSLVGGVPHHLHYRCDVCNITANGPGPCWCCGAPFELREEPVDPSSPVDAERD